MGLESASSLPSSPSVLHRTVGEGHVERELVLLFLGCEAKPPYGPHQHTANLFLDLIARALKRIRAPTTNLTLRVYRVSEGQFPPVTEYDNCDGVILPGSFNSAYEEEPWILNLAKVIQEELVAKARPTLGVCFGHQMYAHSFTEGNATKAPAGPHAGRIESRMTQHGKRWLFRPIDPNENDENNENDEGGLQLYYTHGDMVEKLPPRGFVLAGTEEVPIQAAIYFGQDDEEKKPIAITFQAHPEYASSRSHGLEMTLNPIMKTMQERGDISSEELNRAEADAIREFDVVENQSIQTMVSVGQLLGWFPN